MIFERLIDWEDYQRRGGTGYGIPSTLLSSTSYLTGPPSSTGTRGVQPNVAGSTGGFIGLIAGIAFIVILSLLAGFFLYNRYRRRRTPVSRKELPSLRISQLRDPYAEQGDDITPRQSHFPAGITGRPARPGYMRQRSEEWEIPDHMTHTPNASRSSGKGNGYSDQGDWKDVELPSQPDEVALPLRSRSPRPPSPSARSIDLGRVSSRESASSNPFETDEEKGYDASRLSPSVRSGPLPESDPLGAK